MATKELIPVGELGISKYDESFGSMSKAGDYLPQLRLFGSNTDIVKEGKFPMAEFGLYYSKDKILECGKEVSILVITWRPRAVEVGGDDDFSSVYDPEHSEFKRIMESSGVKDSGCMYGPEFLIYIPIQKVFATLFMCNKTARREAPNIKALIGKAATLGVRLIETKKYKWHGIATVECTTPIDIPSLEEIKTEVDKFNNPKESEELAPDSETESRAR